MTGRGRRAKHARKPQQRAGISDQDGPRAVSPRASRTTALVLSTLALGLLSIDTLCILCEMQAHGHLHINPLVTAVGIALTVASLWHWRGWWLARAQARAKRADSQRRQPR